MVCSSIADCRPESPCKCTGVQDCSFECKGEGCEVHCVGTGDCKITGYARDSKLACTGTGDCVNACTDSTCETRK